MRYNWIYLTILFSIIGCKNPVEQKWEIYQEKYLETNIPSYHYCDTFFVKSDTFYWINSDSSKTIISTDSCRNCKFRKLK
jgi:hypothetical protein